MYDRLKAAIHLLYPVNFCRELPQGFHVLSVDRLRQALELQSLKPEQKRLNNKFCLIPM